MPTSMGNAVKLSGVIPGFDGTIDDFIVEYKLDGTDTLSRVGGDDFRSGPAYPEGVSSMFDGTQYYEDLTGGTPYAGKQGEFTISAWVKTDNKTNPSAILSVGAPLTDGFMLGTTGAGLITFWSNGFNNFTTTGIDYIDGTWKHLLLTVKGTDANLYINGAFSENITLTAVNTFSGAVARVGCQSDAINRQYDGAIDDVRFYDRELSQAEISLLYSYRVDFTLESLTDYVNYDPSDISASNIVETAGLVSSLADKGTYSESVDQAVGVNQPSTFTHKINNLNDIDFSGTTWLQNLTLANPQVQTRFVVAEYISQGAFNTLVTCGIDDAKLIRTADSGATVAIRDSSTLSIAQVINNSQPYIFEGTFDSTNSKIYLNGDLLTTGDAGIDSELGFTMGANTIGNNRTNGYIGEVIQFNGVLTDEIRAKIQGYLAWKWGLVSYLPLGHTYKNSPPLR